MTTRTADYHVARLLLVVDAFGGKDRDWFVGLTKLAKVDFLLRYPRALQDFMASRELQLPEELSVTNLEEQSVESPMIRYRFGPWDNQYYAMVGRMVGTKLAEQARGDRNEVLIRLTQLGRERAADIGRSAEWRVTAGRARLLAEVVADQSGSALATELYTLFGDMFDRPHRTVIR